MRKLIMVLHVTVGLLFTFVPLLFSQEVSQAESADRKVQAFLTGHARDWHDQNIPEIDGRLLYDIIIKHHYTKALEIGTSTGHSGIWIAWALSKTGGKLITVEIDESRHKTALENFRKAGLSQYIDARLADAHQLVPQLKGPFDFVFCDAEDDWYKFYFDATAPKLVVGGCFAAHDVRDSPLLRIKSRIKSLMKGKIADSQNGAPHPLAVYADYLKSLSSFQTVFDDRGAGVAISYKKLVK